MVEYTLLTEMSRGGARKQGPCDEWRVLFRVARVACVGKRESARIRANEIIQSFVEIRVFIPFVQTDSVEDMEA